MLKISLLPWPAESDGIHEVLATVDENLLKGSERFVRQQLSKPMSFLVSHSTAYYGLDKPESYWLNVLSLFNANQQINEACNKIWAASELANITRRDVWKHKYKPIGPDFGRIFASGTFIPTLHYAQISAMISILSSFGCIPILLRGTPFYFVRTETGWRAYVRRNYIRSVFGWKIKGWHDQIIETYFGLISKGISLPKLSHAKVNQLKEMRNEVHYNVLGDLKMWRIPQSHDAFRKFLPLVDKTITASIDTLHKIKQVSTGCDERYSALRRALNESSKLL